MLATHECIAATLYTDLGGLGLDIGTDVSVVCTFPAVDTRSLVPALSHFNADLDAVGIALAETLIGLLPDAPVELRRPTLAAGAARPSRRAPATGARARRRHGVTQAPLRAEDRTQASTKATPATPSSIEG